MKFLAIDTSGSRLTAVAYNGKEYFCSLEADSAQKHSVTLMPQIEEVLSRAQMSAKDCDFFSCVVGPGSFTGIRIGISTVKGLCFALGKPALAVTSFEAIAYAERGSKRLALVPAGHGNCYACAFNGENGVELPPAFLSGSEVEALVGKGYEPVCAEECYPSARKVDFTQGLKGAVTAMPRALCSAQELTALYLRKSAAEEGR